MHARRSGFALRWLRWCAAALVPWAAAPAGAQTAGRPDVAVGDSWQFAVSYGPPPSPTPNRTWVVTAVAPDALRGTENGEPLALTRELNVVDSPRLSESDPRQLSFPLAVGKRWKYTSRWLFKPKSSRGTVAVEVAVVGFEPVVVPAGRFDAFKLRATGELGGTSPTGTFYAGRTTTEYWYAPAARAIVRSVSHNPYLGTTTVELVGLALRN